MGILSSFFLPEATLITLSEVENYFMIAMFMAIVSYFFYAQYEGKQYKHCSSCQIGNIIGTSLIELIKLTIIFGLNYFLL